MIYSVPFVPCVYVSEHNKNVWALHGEDDIGTHVPDPIGILQIQF